MCDIFISYSREDQQRITPFVKALEEQGWSVFWDRRIPAGSTWRDYIGKALTQARCVIVAWSNHSIQSAWVAEEADDAQKRGTFIPVLLDDVLPPIGFRSIQATNLVGWVPGEPSSDFNLLINDIRGVMYSQQGHAIPVNVEQRREQEPVKERAVDKSLHPRFPLKPLRSLILYVVAAIMLIIGFLAIRDSSFFGVSEKEPVPKGLVFASKIEGNGQALDPNTTFKADIANLYAVFRPTMAPPGMAVNVENAKNDAYYAYLKVKDTSSITSFGWRWLYNGEPINEYSPPIVEGQNIWLHFWDYNDGGIFSGKFPPGTYTIIILIDGNPAMSSKLTIEPLDIVSN